MLVVGEEANTLSTWHGIANCVKNGTRKVVSSNRASRSLQCCPHLLSVKFENLVHRFFRNENSDLEINVSHFGVLHWQQWQPPASAPVYHWARVRIKFYGQKKSFCIQSSDTKKVHVYAHNFSAVSFFSSSDIH